MEVRKSKTLEDFPKFIVTAVRRGTTSVTGYTGFELEGTFDRISKRLPHTGFGFCLARKIAFALA